MAANKIAMNEMKIKGEKELFDDFAKLSPQTKQAMTNCVNEVLATTEEQWKDRRTWWSAYRNAIGGSDTSCDLTVFFKTWVEYSPVPPNDKNILPSKGCPTGIPNSPGYYIEKWDWLANTTAGLSLNGFDDEFRVWFIDFLNTHGEWIKSPASIKSLAAWMKYGGTNQHPFDINEYVVPPDGFKSFNTFFLRMVKEGKRPLPPVGNEFAIVSPSDGGTFYLAKSADAQGRYSLPSKRNDKFNLIEAFPGYGKYFIGGPLLDTLLWFTDFHHFFAPVSGTVISMHDYPGSYNYDFDNFDPYHPDAEKPDPGSDKVGWYKRLSSHKRFVWIIKTEKLGLVAMAAIGFWGVGSIVVDDKDKTTWPHDVKPVKTGDYVKKGQYLGHFGYGGSSIVLAFQPKVSDRVPIYDFPTIGSSDNPVLVKARQYIGVAKYSDCK